MLPQDLCPQDPPGFQSGEGSGGPSHQPEIPSRPPPRRVGVPAPFPLGLRRPRRRRPRVCGRGRTCECWDRASGPRKGRKAEPAARTSPLAARSRSILHGARGGLAPWPDDPAGDGEGRRGGRSPPHPHLPALPLSVLAPTSVTRASGVRPRAAPRGSRSGRSTSPNARRAEGRGGAQARGGAEPPAGPQGESRFSPRPLSPPPPAWPPAGNARRPCARPGY